MELYIDDVIVLQSNSTSVSYRWPTSGLLGNTQHSIKAVAYDAKNNQGEASVSVTIAPKARGKK